MVVAMTNGMPVLVPDSMMSPMRSMSVSVSVSFSSASHFVKVNVKTCERPSVRC